MSKILYRQKRFGLTYIIDQCYSDEYNKQMNATDSKKEINVKSWEDDFEKIRADWWLIDKYKEQEHKTIDGTEPPLFVGKWNSST